MKIYLTDQTNKFPDHLHQLCEIPAIEFNKDQLIAKKSIIEISTSESLENINLKVLGQYRIFPDNIMKSLTQWYDEKRAMRIGDTIVQQVFIPPVKWFSQKLIFGVRVCELINEPKRKGFSYETLCGHVEKGISTFTIEKSATDKVTFCIGTLSKPATLLTKIVGPIFSIPFQAYCTKHALQNVKRLTETMQPGK